MRLRAQHEYRRYLRWGVTPRFCRGMAIEPGSGFDAAVRAEARSTRDRGRSSASIGLAVSGLLHAALFLLWPGSLLRPDDGPGDVRRAGARELTVVRIALPEQEEPSGAPARTEPAGRPRPALEIDVIDPPEQEIVTLSVGVDLAPVDASAGADLAPLAVLRPFGSGAGHGDGEGEQGSGQDRGGDGGQAGGQFVAPSARSILPSWKAPSTVYGLVVLARVHTDAGGRATGPVELTPPTPSRRTNEEIVERVRSLAYWPARRDGVPVDAWAEITFVFCYEGVTATSSTGVGRTAESPCPRGG